MRVAILGNSGSGKSTLARWLAARTGAAMLDLDTIAWEPGAGAVLRPEEAARADVRAFCSTHADWIAEGCYAGLIDVALEFSPRLVFLNPGTEQCAANCRARPFEPHKYATRREQDEQLASLLAWVREYETRSGDLSLAGHRACFEAYGGPKLELSAQPSLETPPAALLALIA